MSTHLRNVILSRRRVVQAGIPLQGPGICEQLSVVTPHQPDSGQATATWISPEGSEPGTLDYIMQLTGGVGTVTIISIVPVDI
jgi:hypothetical protein